MLLLQGEPERCPSPEGSQAVGTAAVSDPAIYEPHGAFLPENSSPGGCNPTTRLNALKQTCSLSICFYKYPNCREKYPVQKQEGGLPPGVISVPALRGELWLCPSCPSPHPPPDAKNTLGVQ